MPYRFNPFTGTFDWTDDLSEFEKFVPISLSAGEVYTVPADSQALFVRNVALAAGAKITIAANSVVVQVT